ncbi:MAG: 4Fe-4S binding protein [Verrucomicrobiota bacterium]
MNRRLITLFAISALVLFISSPARSEPRFPPPDFESGYHLPVTPTPPARGLWLEYVDVTVLVAGLGLATYFVLKLRSRRAVAALSLFSLAYFGFYRQGCICSIGAVQNLALGLFEPSYAVPIAVVAFFLLPLVVALWAGRSFCAAVCPHGALQDVVLLRPVKVPSWLEHTLGLIPYAYLGAAVAFAGTGSAFIICQYDPFVPLFRRSGSFRPAPTRRRIAIEWGIRWPSLLPLSLSYGALLKLAAKVSKWRVTVTPNAYSAGCVNIRAHMAPFRSRKPRPRQLLASGRTVAGWVRCSSACLYSPSVRAGPLKGPPQRRPPPSDGGYGRIVSAATSPPSPSRSAAAALALRRAEDNPKSLLAEAVRIQKRFVSAGWAFGVWMGLVFGFKLIGLSLRQQRADFEPDRGELPLLTRCYCPAAALPSAAASDSRPSRWAHSPTQNAT